MAEATGWSDAQAALVHALLGTPGPLTAGPIGRVLAELGEATATGLTLVTRAREEIDRLWALRAVVAVIDGTTRATVAAGLSDLPTARPSPSAAKKGATRRHLVWVTNRMRGVGLVVRARPGADSITVAATSLPADAPVSNSIASPVMQSPPVPSPPELIPALDQPVLRIEPTRPDRADETNPLTAWLANLDATIKPAKRPDLAKKVKR